LVECNCLKMLSAYKPIVSTQHIYTADYDDDGGGGGWLNVTA